MKLSDNQKKWALTASLATVLSFNLVLSLGSSASGSATMASTDENFTMQHHVMDSADARIKAGARPNAESSRAPQAEKANDNQIYDDVTIDGEKVRVLYERNGDKTYAVIGKKNSNMESGFCFAGCNNEVHILGVSSTNTAILFASLKDARGTSTAAKESKETPAPEEKEEPVSRTMEVLNKIDAKCGNGDKYSSDESRLKCYSTELINSLKAVDALRKNKFEMNKKDLTKFFVDNIAKTILDLSKDGVDSSSREAVSEVINKIASDLPKKYNYLRQTIAKVSSAVVSRLETETRNAAITYKNLSNLAKSNPGNADIFNQKEIAWTKLNEKQALATQTATDLNVQLRNGFIDAVNSEYISVPLAQEYISQDYQNVVGPILQGFQKSIQELRAGMPNATIPNIPSSSLASLATLTLADGSTLLVNLGNANTLTGVNAANAALTVNGLKIIGNGLTSQNVIIPGTTPMIMNNGGQNTAQIIAAPAGGQVQMGTRTTFPQGIPQIGR